MKKPKTNKYHARRTGNFDSDAERDYDAILKLLKMAGVILTFVHHPDPVMLLKNPSGKNITWHLDFWVQQDKKTGYYVEVNCGYRRPAHYRSHTRLKRHVRCPK